MRLTSALALALLLGGCGGDEAPPAGAGDVAQVADAAPDPLDTTAPDAGTPSEDAGSDLGGPDDVTSDLGEPQDAAEDVLEPQDAGEDLVEPQDAGEDSVEPDDAGPADAGPVEWPEDPVAGQCVTGADCQSGLCNASAPGGFCQGCGECPSGYDCNFGTCNQWCEDDVDCPPGLRCQTNKGFCLVQQCEQDSECFGPYACLEGLCRRPPCDESGGCPAPLTCQGSLCVEPPG